MHIISIVGGHAGDGLPTILSGKKEDISKYGWCLWNIKSYTCKPSTGYICDKVYFVAPSRKGSARPTKSQHRFTKSSIDNQLFQDLPEDMLVTGYTYNGAYALRLTSLDVTETKINLAAYSFKDGICKFGLGFSTRIAEVSDSLMSTPRTCYAIGTLAVENNGFVCLQ